MATVFVGGSALLLAGAMAALAFGFANGEDSLVWTALIASGAAAVFLVIAYVISRREMRRATSARDAVPEETTSERPIPEPPTDEVATQEDAGEERSRDDTSSDEDPGSAEEGEARRTEDEGGPAAVPAAAAMASGGPTAKPSGTAKKSSAPSTAAAAKPSSPTDTVVGIATKKKFHRTDCRYASSDSAEEMTRAAARKRGFSPCGICKP